MIFHATRSPLSPGRLIARLTLAALALTMPGACSLKQRELNLSEYPDLPSEPLTHATRAVIKSNKFMRTRGIWGKYGGPGSEDGPPIDAMDEYFRQHDLAYLQGTTLDELIASDRLLISQLEGLDPTELSPEANQFRLGAIDYFERPISRILGKPSDVLFRVKRRPVIIDTSPAP